MNTRPNQSFFSEIDDTKRKEWCYGMVLGGLQNVKSDPNVMELTAIQGRPFKSNCTHGGIYCLKSSPSVHALYKLVARGKLPELILEQILENGWGMRMDMEENHGRNPDRLINKSLHGLDMRWLWRKNIYLKKSHEPVQNIPLFVQRLREKGTLKLWDSYTPIVAKNIEQSTAKRKLSDTADSSSDEEYESDV